MQCGMLIPTSWFWHQVCASGHLCVLVRTRVCEREKRLLHSRISETVVAILDVFVGIKSSEISSRAFPVWHSLAPCEQDGRTGI